jgi:hypothetical protein
MVPGLEEHLMDGTDEDIVHIAELVCGLPFFVVVAQHALTIKDRSKKGCPVQGQMILRV